MMARGRSHLIRPMAAEPSAKTGRKPTPQHEAHPQPRRALKSFKTFKMKTSFYVHFYQPAAATRKSEHQLTNHWG